MAGVVQRKSIAMIQSLNLAGHLANKVSVLARSPTLLHVVKDPAQLEGGKLDTIRYMPFHIAHGCVVDVEIGWWCANYSRVGTHARGRATKSLRSKSTPKA
jgi:hypothetical protein